MKKTTSLKRQCIDLLLQQLLSPSSLFFLIKTQVNGARETIYVLQTCVCRCADSVTLCWGLYLHSPPWSYWSFGSKYLLCWSITAETAVPCRIRTSLSDGPSHTVTDLLAGRVSLWGFAETTACKIEGCVLLHLFGAFQSLKRITHQNWAIKIELYL